MKNDKIELQKNRVTEDKWLNPKSGRYKEGSKG